MLPGNLPCDLGDRQCWENLRQKGKEIDYPITFAQSDPISLDDKMDYQFDRYYTYGFGII